MRELADVEVRQMAAVLPAAEPRIETRAVSYQVGAAKLVDSVSLQARAGEVLALVGPNGAGKSTMLRLLAHELTPTDGEVLVEGRPIGSYHAKDLAKRRAVLPQQTVMQFAFTALDVVMMGRNPHIENGWPGPEDRAIAEGSMQQTGTLEFRQRAYPGLSGGEQSRVTFARVLAQETPILLLDEPTASLDVKYQEQAMQITRRLAAEGACVVVIIHDLNLAAAYADRIALLHRGRLVDCAPPASVLRGERLSEVFETPLRVIEDDGQLFVTPARR
ncbi:MAG: heme ABC transporter ATP-binding protein [Dehalococcoidia bacterium]